MLYVLANYIDSVTYIYVTIEWGNEPNQMFKCDQIAYNKLITQLYKFVNIH